MIRRAKVADAAAVHALLLSAKDEIPLPDSFDDDAHKAWVRDRCRDNRVRMLEHEGQIAGAAVLEGDEIAFLVTAPEHRHKGFAEALVEDATARVRRRHRKAVHLRVRLDNAPMIGLLEKLRFVPDEDQPLRPGWTSYRAPSA
jgi:ribosomal protein S18 acetylase RimI-like enzyme